MFSLLQQTEGHRVHTRYSEWPTLPSLWLGTSNLQ